MEIKEYERFVRSSRVYRREDAIPYCALGLNGEAGEVAEKVKKWMRGDTTLTFDQFCHAVALELGDTLWYLANLADEVGYSLSEVMHMNVDKLEARQLANTVKGSGDNR